MGVFFFFNPLWSTENPRQTIRFMSHSRGNCSRTIRRYLNVPPSEIFLHFRSQPRLSLLPRCFFPRNPRTPYNANVTPAPPTMQKREQREHPRAACAEGPRIFEKCTHPTCIYYYNFQTGCGKKKSDTPAKSKDRENLHAGSEWDPNSNVLSNRERLHAEWIVFKKMIFRKTF